MSKFRLLAMFSGLVAATPVHAGTAAVCPFTPDEVQQALNLPFNAGKPGLELSFGTGKMLDCRYEDKKRRMTLMVKQTVMNRPEDTRNWEAGLAGGKEKVPNDPDGAIWQLDQGDMTNPTLHYARGGAIVELRVMGVGPKAPEFDGLRKSLVKLRRLP